MLVTWSVADGPIPRQIIALRTAYYQPKTDPSELCLGGQEQKYAKTAKSAPVQQWASNQNLAADHEINGHFLFTLSMHLSCAGDIANCYLFGKGRQAGADIQDCEATDRVCCII